MTDFRADAFDSDAWRSAVADFRAEEARRGPRPSAFAPAGSGMQPPLPDEAYAAEFADSNAKPSETVARTSAFFSAAALEGLPVSPRQWLVPDLIPARTVTMLGGDGGTGKSLLAQQLACSAVIGRPWLGRTVKPGRALYLSAEDDDELHRRLADILRAEAATFADLDKLTVRSLAGEDALLAIPDPKTGVLVPTPLFSELDERIGDERPGLVALDTLADLHSGQENDRATARQFIGLLRGLAISHDCAVVLLAYPSLTGMASGSGLSGSTAWNASVRSRLYLERVVQDGDDADPDRRVLRTVKANYGRTGGEIGMTWRDGVFVADEAETSVDRMAGAAKAERVFLKLLRAFTD